MEQGMFHGHPAPEGRHHQPAHPGEGRRGYGPHHGGPGGRGGRGKRIERRARSAVLLDLLREGPKHGYELIRRFEERTWGQYAPSPGVLYPTLQLLGDLGLVTSQPEGDRRVYHLAEAGQAELEAYAEQVAAFWIR